MCNIPNTESFTAINVNASVSMEKYINQQFQAPFNGTNACASNILYYCLMKIMNFFMSEISKKVRYV